MHAINKIAIVVSVIIANCLVTATSSAQPSSAPSASPDAIFTEANAAYEQGEFSKAQSLYEQIVAAKQFSPDLFYNLGNTYARLDQPGLALLNYQRALALHPHHAEAALNASYLRSSLPEIPATSSPAAQFFSHFSANDYALLATLGLWTLATTAAIALLTRLTPLLASIALLSALTFALGLAGFFTQRPLDPNSSSAMSIVPEARAHFAPASSSPVVAPIPPGTPLTILTEKNDWLYVRLPDQRLGWMPKNSTQKLIPQN